MVWISDIEDHPIAPECFLVDIVHVIMLQDLTVDVVGAVAEHHGQRLAVETSVSLVAALVRAVGDIIVDIDWLLMIVGFRNGNIDHRLAIHLDRSEIAVEKDITAHLLTIVEDIEEVGLDFIRIRYTGDLKPGCE